MLALAVAIAASLALSRAQVTPSEPAPGRDFQIGGSCEISWTPDTTGTWGTTYIQLMTGSNDAMVHITTVHQFDGSSSAETSFTYPCPDVTPHSAIYFYQFTSAGASEPQWTGRFSISNNHDLVPPTETDASGIAWGTGALVNPALAVAPPPTVPGGSETPTTPQDPTTPSNPTTPSDPASPDTPAQTTAPSTRPGPGHPIPPAGGANTGTPASQPSETPEATTQPDNAAGSLRVSSVTAAMLAVAAVAFAAL